jgi:hypothetical protein
VLTLEGPPVALVAHGMLLAAVWHSGAPSVHRDQVSETSTRQDMLSALARLGCLTWE